MTKVPFRNTLWKYIGHGNGHGDFQRVIDSNVEEVVTISERATADLIDWSWLGSLTEFWKVFQFVSNTPET